jgi:hypothetical protein
MPDMLTIAAWSATYAAGYLTTVGQNFLGDYLTDRRHKREAGADLVTSILAKSCKTFRGIRAAAVAGCGQDASILLRALFESTVALLYILQRDSRRRAILFAAHQSQRRLVLIEATKKTPGQKRFFKNTLVTTAEVATVRKHWAGRGGLEAATTKLGRGYGTLG